MHALRNSGHRRGTFKIARDKVHLWLQSIPEIKATDSKTAKGSLVSLFSFFHPVVGMKLSCVIAHLLHSFKAQFAFIANVQALLVLDLLVLHKFLYLAEFFPACVARVFLEQARQFLLLLRESQQLLQSFPSIFHEGFGW